MGAVHSPFGQYVYLIVTAAAAAAAAVLLTLARAHWSDHHSAKTRCWQLASTTALQIHACGICNYLQNAPVATQPVCALRLLLAAQLSAASSHLCSRLSRAPL